MAKKALVAKAERKPKFEVRGYTRCQRCGRAARGLPRVRPLPDLRPGDGARGASCPASPSPAGSPELLPSRPRDDARSGPATGPERETTARRGNRPHDDDRPDRRHADASAQRQLGVPRHRGHAALEDQGAHRRDPPAGGLHRRLDRRGRRRRARQDAVDRPEVRPEPRALDRRPAPGLQARPAGLREGDQPAAGARRPRRRDHLDVARAC